MKEMVGGCCVCADENGWTDNPLIYCDGENCEVAVHQGCYGIQEVPDGEWFCAKCTKAAVMAPGTVNSETFCCELCPFDYGALKKTDRKDGWAHVICALYIPEVRFGNVHSMEPVILSDVPVDKFQKSCYICLDERPNSAKKGACMSCNKNNCKRSFHVTCAQRKGLLCEEGAVSRNVKYCGYCESHLKKVINDPTIKVIPACPPIQRFVEKQEKQKKEKHSTTATTSTVLLTPPPPVPPKGTPMLADPIRPSTNQVNNSVLGLGSAINSVSLEDRPPPSSSTSSGIFANPPTAFSPPLTTSSRSSVAPDPTPPLATNFASKNNSTASGPLIPSTAKPTTATSLEKPMANGSTLPETTVGSHCLQQLHNSASAGPSGTTSDLNGYPGPSQLSSFMHEIPARNTTSVASLLPPNAADFQLNGSGMDEEKTVKAVLTAPLAKAKRMRDSKHDIIDKSHKRPRANGRPPAVLGSSTSSSGGTVGKSASMQRLINLVQPVVTEVVTDFQRERVADRTVAERRAAVVQSQPSTSTNGVLPPNVAAPPPPQQQNPPPSVDQPMMNSANPPQPPPSHQNNGIPQNVAAPPPPQVQMPGPSTSTGEQGAVTNGTCQTQHSRLHTIPSFMEQLLERQWDQGSSLFLSSASFDVAQLMSCLFQLKSENLRLEDNLTTLRKRRDHLFALNSRLAEVNTQDLARKREAAQLSELSAVPKTEVPKQEVQPVAHTVQANHSSVLFEEIKPPTKSHKKAAAAPPAPTTIAHPVPLSTPTALSTASTPAPVTMATAAIPNHRATPSTAGAPLAATPIMTAVTAANELATLSPEHVANHTQALLSMYARNQMPGAMDANSVAAQISMIQTIQQQVSNQHLFSRMLQNPGLAGISAMLTGGLQPGAQALAAIPSTSATPNGK